MKNVKNMVLALLAGLTFVTGAQATSEGIAWDRAPDRGNDFAALQNGAKLFANYCLNCHSAAFMRYNRLTDIGLTEKQIKDNLLFATDKVGETMKAAIDPKQAKAWFGGNPPDLSVIVRSRADSSKGSGADYIYTYLRTYYRDDTKATGWNNLAFPNVGMPHVLWELQGERAPVFEKISSHGHEAQVLKGWQQVTPGSMSVREYDSAVADLVAYMKWMAEPAQNTRVRVGAWVLLFLGLFIVVAWRLNASYWKDVK